MPRTPPWLLISLLDLKKSKCAGWVLLCFCPGCRLGAAVLLLRCRLGAAALLQDTHGIALGSTD